MGSTAAAALDELGSLPHQVAGMQVLVGHEVLADHYGYERLVVTLAAIDTERLLRQHVGHLEGKVLNRVARYVGNKYMFNHPDTLNVDLCGIDYLIAHLHQALLLSLLHLLVELGILGNGLLYGSLDVLLTQYVTQGKQYFLHLVEALLGSLTGNGLNAAHSGSHTALRHDAHKAYLTGSLHVAAAAKFNAVAKLHHAHLVTIFLAKQGHGAQFLSLLQGHVAVVLDRQVLADAGVDQPLHLAQLIMSHLLEMTEVKAQPLRGYQRALLLHMGAQHLAQSLVNQVGS